MRKILVTGANGQLGSELNVLSHANANDVFVFADRAILNITDGARVHEFIVGGNYNAVVNCAAYTAVDKAEAEQELAFKINADAAGNLAKACKQAGTRSIYVSTDFVFDGSISRPLLEDDKTNPLGVYGASKLEGEKLVQQYCPDAMIIRTSWLIFFFW